MPPYISMAVKLPKVGSLVCVIWRDSGVLSVRDEFPDSELRTGDMTTFGILTYIGEQDIVVCSDGDLTEGSPNLVRHGIWIPSIQKISILRLRP